MGYGLRTAEYTRTEREKRRAAGMCRYCSNKAVSGRTMCSKHLKYHRDAYHRRRSQ